MSRTLVVYYSRTGHTRRLAEVLRTLCSADLAEIREPAPRTGLPGWARCGLEATFRIRPKLQEPAHDLKDYDLVLVGGPVWMGRLAPAVRAYVALYGPQANRLAFFSTQGGPPVQAAWADLETLGGRHPVATYGERNGTPEPIRLAGAQRFAARAERGHSTSASNGTLRAAHP